jgi:hypothetical protein
VGRSELVDVAEIDRSLVSVKRVAQPDVEEDILKGSPFELRRGLLRNACGGRDGINEVVVRE